MNREVLQLDERSAGEVLTRRRLPIGAEIVRGVGTHFRLWAPRRTRVELVIETPGPKKASAAVALTPEGNGYFSARVAQTPAGTLYSFRLDEGTQHYPDPASRFQPQGPHGPSQIVDPDAFEWTDQGWRGISRRQQVLYELHVGTFTREGTWRAAARELAELAAIGITAVEIMPIAEFAGTFGWGYDGVDLYAPSRLYGTPDDFRRFVDRAHALGVGVILDVVYNHFGPDGCYLRQFSPDYFTDRYENDWGEAINFDDDDAGPVREFFVANAGYWIDEFHLDGLRLDATQQMFDSSAEHIAGEVVRAARRAADAKRLLIVAENEPQDVRIVRPQATGGCGVDLLWNDDFHHSACVAAGGTCEAYYTDYAGTPQELVSLAKWGFLYQGQRYRWQNARRGTPALRLGPAVLVNYLQNHDQVANSIAGARLHTLTSPGRYRALTAFLLLAPGTPMLLQGQEFAASAPFLYFADHEPELAAAVRKGRGEFLQQFPSMASAEARAVLSDPGARDTFERCKLDFTERERHGEIYALHRDLVRLRREDPVFNSPRMRSVDGAVIGPEALVLRYFSDDPGDRLLLLNLGRDLALSIAPEPLLAPPEGCDWQVAWSSEALSYGGKGTAPVERDDGWHIPGAAAVVLNASAREQT